MKPDPRPLAVPCPQCQKPVSWHQTPTRPFCSKRCQTFDQAAWAAEGYSIAALPDESSLSEEQED